MLVLPNVSLPARRAVVKGDSGAIDVVAWDEPHTSTLKHAEGDYVLIENAEVGEHEGSRQLTFVDGLTEVSTIQAGVGHTDGETTGAAQTSLETTCAQTDDGRPELEGVQAKVIDHLREQPKEPLSAATVAGVLSEAPDDVASALDHLVTKGRVVKRADGFSLE